MGLRLLKFDQAYPLEYLFRESATWPDLSSLTRSEYRKRVLELRLNYSDYYTHHLSNLGWEAEEFLLGDPKYLELVAKELYPIRNLPRLIKGKVRSWLRYFSAPIHIIDEYTRRYEPDVIFVREPSTIPSAVWRKFASRSLLVSRIAWRMPNYWHPNDFDLIHTLTPEFKDFFLAHGVPTQLVPYGFDQRILTQLGPTSKKHEVGFIGNVGGPSRLERTRELNELHQAFPFVWWGNFLDETNRFPKLRSAWRGSTGGIEMFRLYQETKINLNSYSDIACGHAVNQRLYEVIGVGSFLLTKSSPSLKAFLPKDLLVTYESTKDCVDKIKYYLKNEKEREELARKAQAYLLANHSFERGMGLLSTQLLEAHAAKFAKARPFTLKVAA